MTSASSDRTSEPPAAMAETVIEPSRGWLSLNLREVWRYRELLQLIVWRNTVVRYKQSVLGVGWAVVKPVGQMIVFSIIFGGLAGFNAKTSGIPYPIFAYAALLPWGYFSACLGGASSSLVGGAGLMAKVYFPRLILPLSNLLTGLVDFAISFCVLVALMIWYRHQIVVTWAVVCLPAFLLLAMMTALAFGLWLSSFMVKYRDVEHLMPFLTQIWMYLSPVIYPADMVPDRFRLLYALNPMTGVIEGFRWALVGHRHPHWGAMAVSAGVTLAILVTGLYYFRKTERTYVDIV